MTTLKRDNFRIERTESIEDLVEVLNERFRTISEKLSQIGGLDGTFTFSGAVDMDGNRIKNLPLSGHPQDPMPRKEIIDLLRQEHTILEEVIASRVIPETNTGIAGIAATLQLTSLTPNRLIQSDGSNYLTSVADLTSWVAATADQTTITDDGDGTLTVGTVQDINTTSSPTFNALTVSNAIGAGSLSTSGHITTTSGTLTSGTNDVQRGYLRLYGAGSPGTYGGSAYFYTAADHDTDIDNYTIQTLRDDFLFSDDANGVIFQITGNGANPTVDFNYNISDAQLTANRLLSSNGSKVLTSTDLTSWVSGTANQITSTDDGDGTITLSTPQNIHTGASPTFANLYVPTTGITGVSGGPYWTYITANDRILSYAASYRWISDTNFAPELTAINYNAAANGPSVSFIKNRGTQASPASVASGDYLGLFYFYGGLSGLFYQAGYFGARVDAAPGAGIVPCRIFFATRASGGGISEHLIIKSDGNSGFNEASPAEDVHANDTVRADVAFNLNGTDGWSGSFTNGDGDTVTVSGGIITGVA